MASTLTLAEALAVNGVEEIKPEYASVKVSVAPALLRRAWSGTVRAMTLPRKVFVSQEWFDRIVAGRAARLLRHESVHVDQWRRHGRVGFLTKYLWDYLRLRASGLPHQEAYRAIPFEKEAVSRSE